MVVTMTPSRRTLHLEAQTAERRRRRQEDGVAMKRETSISEE
jgi:hypothetical protein